MRTPTLEQALLIYERMIGQSGGSSGVRDLGVLEGCLAQPRMTFGGEDLYPTLAEKAAALGFSVVRNHPFVDGNKRAGYLLMEAFLMMNGHELRLDVDAHEDMILRLAAGQVDRDEFADWVRSRVERRGE